MVLTEKMSLFMIKNNLVVSQWMDKVHSGTWDYFFIYYNFIMILDIWPMSDAMRFILWIWNAFSPAWREGIPYKNSEKRFSSTLVQFNRKVSWAWGRGSRKDKIKILLASPYIFCIINLWMERIPFFFFFATIFARFAKTALSKNLPLQESTINCPHTA